MSRKIIIFCLTIFLVLTCSYTVFAEEYNPDLTGSISVTLTDKKQNEAIVGAELSVYYVATVLLDDDGNLISNSLTPQSMIRNLQQNLMHSFRNIMYLPLK